jgi:hypothetical protein
MAAVDTCDDLLQFGVFILPDPSEPCFCGDPHDDEPPRVVVEADPCEMCCEDER